MITDFVWKIAVFSDGEERGHIEVDNNHICISVNGEEAVHSGVIIPRQDTYYVT